MNEESLFTEALDIPDAGQRAEFLERSCRGDAALRDRLERLLDRHAQAGSFLGCPAIAPPEPDPARAHDQPGTVIGPYKLLEQIGEGGFGVVFMAEQSRPVRRKVAVKVLKPGMDTRQVVARFEAERQALALMDHPNIAKVFDGGETASGRPYFVMELVRGIPVTDFCDQNHLAVRDRLELFIQVCHAVQHAHQKGVIHRDLKPSNVLVTFNDGAPIPKVIDFGIAKAAGQSLTDKTLFTNFAQMIGTPLYMSPEQAQMSAVDVDTRTDVYALGVLLYELLTGTTPFDKECLRTAAYDEIRRIIREEEPARPSTRLSTLGQVAQTVSANRGSEPRKLSALVRGELDWIVMKALEKDRNRRYETASALAADIRRYLDNEPVQACPPTAGYRFRKFARRNRRALATAIVVAGSVLPALGAAAASIGWAARERAARTAALELEAGRALDEAESWYARDNLPEALGAVKRAEAITAGDAGGEPLRERVRRWRADLAMVGRLEDIRLLQAELREHGYFDLARADPAYAAAFRDFGLDVAAMTPDTAAAAVRASAIRTDLVNALDDWVIWVKPKEDQAGRDHLLAVVRLADPDDWRNRFRDSVHLGNRQVLEQLADRPEVAGLSPTSVVLLGRALQSVGSIRKSLAVVSAAQERHPADFWLNVEVGALLLWKLKPARGPQAAGYFRAALAVRPDNAGVYCNLGGALRQSPDSMDAAIAAYRKAVELRPDYVSAYVPLGALYLRKGAWAESIAAYGAAARLAPDDPQSHNDLGVALSKGGRTDEAVVRFREAVRLKPTHALYRHNLGVGLFDQGLWAESATEYRAAIDLKPDYFECHRDLALAEYRRGRLEDAVAASQTAIGLKADDANVHSNLAAALRELGRQAQAVASCRRAIALNPKLARPYYHLGLALADQGDGEGSATAFREQAAVLTRDVESAPRSAPAANALAWFLATCPEERLRDPVRSVKLAELAVEVESGRANYWNTLAAARYRAGDCAAALDALEKAKSLRPRPDGVDWILSAMAHWRLEDRDQARRCYTRAIEWAESNRWASEDDRRLAAEAAKLLGVPMSDKK